MSRSSRVVLALVLLLPACAPFQSGPLGSSQGTPIGIGPRQQSPEQIQAEVMIFVDRYWAMVTQVMDDVRRGADTPQRRLGAQSLKISAVEAAVRIATDENPVVALLDMTVMVSLMRQVWDEYWGPKVYQEPPDGPVGTVFRTLEEEIWTIAERILTPQETGALRQLIVDMRAKYPDQVYVVNMRASEFASASPLVLKETTGGPNLLSLFAIDPLSSLAPATREIQRSRMLAERAFFYASRLPAILSWRTDRAILFAAAMPEVGEARDAVREFRTTGDRLAAIAEEIMDDLEIQRDAAINQFFTRLEDERSTAIEQLFEHISAERKAIVDLLEHEGGDIRSTLGQVDSTARTATALSESLQKTMVQTESLARTIAELGAGDETGGTGRPFDIREYQAATESAATAARDLQALVASVTRLVESPDIAEGGRQLAATVDQADRAAEELLHQAFRLAMVLVITAVLLSLGAAVAYRLIARRIEARRPAPAAR